MKYKRVPISKKLRFDVFKRDEFICQYCGKTPPSTVLEVDHIIPVSKGGDNNIVNLICSCFECNRGKRNEDLNTVPLNRNEIIEKEKELQEQMKELNNILKRSRLAEAKNIENLGKHWFNQIGSKKDVYIFGSGRQPSIRGFLKKLPVEEIYDAIDISFAKFPNTRIDADYKMWKYFCGVCWTKIKKYGGVCV